MTELEKMKHAKSYIDRLANGVNPLTGQPAPSTDLINNVQIARCLFYVSDLLRQMIEHNGTAKRKPRAAKLSFQLDIDKRMQFPFSDAPISASEIARRINSLIDTETMTKLKYRAIVQWLLELDALTLHTNSAGSAIKRPTKMGRDLGIILEHRQGLNGTHAVVLYNLSAQHIIIDNLDAIIQLN